MRADAVSEFATGQTPPRHALRRHALRRFFPEAFCSEGSLGVVV